MSAAAHSVDAVALLRQYGLRPRHALGQNFLQDREILRRIVDAASLTPDDTVLEIGCGFGSLTGYLAEAAKQVVAVEVDKRLAAIARHNLRSFDNVRILPDDFLKLDSTVLGLPSNFIVAANIPYHVTSAILRRLLEGEDRPRLVVLTVQKEVAHRICASPPDMSLLAISVQVYGRPYLVFEIPADRFYPKPDVDSAVVRIDCAPEPPFSSARQEDFFRVVRAGFSQPRKMLRNALAAGLALGSPQVVRMLEHAGIDPRRRAETLSIAEWMILGESVEARRSTAGNAS